MKFPPVTRDDLSELLSSYGEDQAGALTYTLQLGRVFAAIGLLEQATVGLLLLASGQTAGSDLLARQKKLKSSTFGQLVTRIGQAGVSGLAFDYLKRVNTLRNTFVHSWFWEYPFPSELDADAEFTKYNIDMLERHWRHFRCAEILLSRILCRAGAVNFIDLGDAGRILWPREEESIFSEDDYVEILKTSGRI